jgi:hypothetical protein
VEKVMDEGEIIILACAPDLRLDVEKAACIVPVGSHWRHRKGSEYAVEGHCMVESTCTVGVLYRSVEGILWVRSLEEFTDGRFHRIG